MLAGVSKTMDSGCGSFVFKKLVADGGGSVLMNGRMHHQCDQDDCRFSSQLYSESCGEL